MKKLFTTRFSIMLKQVLVLSLFNLLFMGALQAQTTGDFRSKMSGGFFTAANWETWNGSAWVTATVNPGTTLTGNATIRAGHVFTGGSALSTGTKTLTIQGTGSYTASGTITITVASGGEIVNGGTLAAGGVIAINGTLTNSGTINHTAGAFNVTGTLTNSGTINKTGGGTTVNTAGTFTNSGTVSVSSSVAVTINGILNNNSTGTFTSTNSTFTNAGTGTITNSGTISISPASTNAGTYQGTGSFTGAADLASGGTVSPGTAGTVGALTIAKPFTSSGTLTIDLPTVSSFDVINVTGTAGITGVINATFGFVPAVNARFKIVNATGVATGGATVSVTSPIRSTVTASYDGATGEIVILTSLSIELSKFGVKNNKTSNVLTWTTASENDNALFNIEHSENGVDFKAIGEMKGNGTVNTASEYNYEHNTPSVGINYYRLKQVDFNGTFSLSKIVSIQFGGKSTVLSLYPTVASDKLNINFDSERTMPYTIFDLQGKTVQTGQLNGQKEIIISHLTEGLYILNVAGSVARFIKN